ncbi:MAG: hypothetical protein QOG64_2136, partial [Acidimicrobiaceae bacterium]|nr:hypothetical protein [Acidimicrobiaceae bacterium]
MATDERSRHELYRKLEEILGLERATTLMEHLPPSGWGDVATKTDIALVRADVVVLRADMTASLGGVRGDLEVLRADMTASLGGVRGDLEVLR